MIVLLALNHYRKRHDESWTGERFKNKSGRFVTNDITPIQEVGNNPVSDGDNARFGETDDPVNSINSAQTQDGKSRYDKWMSLAKGSYLNLVSEENLDLNDAVCDLLDIPLEERAQLKQMVSDCLDGVQRREIEAAYVRTDASGNEEIVVPALDFSDIRDELQSQINSRFDDDIARFITDLTYYDNNLKMTGAELRMYVEDDAAGHARLTINTEVTSRNADPGTDSFVKDGIRFSSNFKLSIQNYADKGVGKRYEKLFQNAQALPRKHSEISLD